MVREINKIVISLPERTDRIIEFNEQIKFIEADHVNVIQGVREKPNWKGIAKAHMNAIRFAKEKGWDKVLIMEDDCQFPGEEKTLPYMEEAFKRLPEDWEIVVGGVYYLRQEERVNAYWRKISEFCALHWYIVNSKVYDRMFNWDGSNHYDRWVGKQGFKVYKPRRIYPFFLS